MQETGTITTDAITDEGDRQMINELDQTKIVYTVSDVDILIKQVLRSIKTLSRFVEKDKIIVFYTPPRSERNFKELSKVANVIKAENLTEPFVFQKPKGYGRYGEKIHLCDVNQPNVIFLDADTIIKRNPLELLRGEFDFSARAGPPNRYFNQKVWGAMFERIGKKPIPMPNAGFMIFKNSCHREIKKEWLKYINSLLPNFYPKAYQKEQYALALAISGKKIRWMTAKEHAFIWEGEGDIDTFVLHGARIGIPVRKQIRARLLRLHKAFRAGDKAYKIYRYDSVSSTNDIAKEIAKKSGTGRIVIIAETQTRGKCRMERHWLSPKGGVWLSIILRPQIGPKEALRLTFIMSSAVAKTIRNMFGLKTEVKWPNDVLVNGRKICGISTETSTKENIVEFVVLGVGINANIDLESFPSSLRNAVTSLKHELGYKIKRKTFTKNLLQNFEQRYKRLQRGRWTALLQEWKNLATFLGSQVEVTSFAPRHILVGEAYDVDDDGALIIRLENGALKKIVAGDVTLRKQP